MSFNIIQGKLEQNPAFSLGLLHVTPLESCRQTKNVVQYYRLLAAFDFTCPLQTQRYQLAIKLKHLKCYTYTPDPSER